MTTQIQPKEYHNPIQRHATATHIHVLLDSLAIGNHKIAIPKKKIWIKHRFVSRITEPPISATIIPIFLSATSRVGARALSKNASFRKTFCRRKRFRFMRKQGRILPFPIQSSEKAVLVYPISFSCRWSVSGTTTTATKNDGVADEVKNPRASRRRRKGSLFSSSA